MVDWRIRTVFISTAASADFLLAELSMLTGEQFCQVDALKGESPRVVAEMPTLLKAAKEMRRIFIPER